jgi:GNAT superfamily N-acetyltransferase
MRSVTLRPATRDDLEPMFELHEAAMRGHVERTWGPWDAAWQWNYFREHFHLSRCRIVLVDSQIAGYFQVAREPDHFFIEFIILAPAFHGRGVGTLLIQDLLAEASRAKLPVGLQVLKVSPARRLYERLGFALLGETETHFLMEAPPARGSAETGDATEREDSSL